MIETAFDVAFQYPRRSCFLAQHGVALFDRIRRASLRPEPIGVPVRQAFRDRFQRQQVERLHRPV